MSETEEPIRRPVPSVLIEWLFDVALEAATGACPFERRSRKRPVKPNEDGARCFHQLENVGARQRDLLACVGSEPVHDGVVARRVQRVVALNA
ncbi:MAG: hypothetical protein Rubg2KO_31290 [Rubricoccaceae bacterium]